MSALHPPPSTPPYPHYPKEEDGSLAPFGAQGAVPPDQRLDTGSKGGRGGHRSSRVM